MELGDKIRLARKEAKLKQKELASLSGIHPSVLCRYEKNCQQPTIKNIVELAKVLRVSIYSLLSSGLIENFNIHWEKVEPKQQYASLQMYLLENGVVTLLEGESVLTDCRNLIDSYYIWIGVRSLCSNKCSIDRGVRILMIYQPKEIKIGDIVLFQKGNQLLLGDVYPKSMITYYQDNKQINVNKREITIAAKMVSLALDL